MRQRFHLWMGRIAWRLFFAPMSPEDKEVLGAALLQASIKEWEK